MSGKELIVCASPLPFSNKQVSRVVPHGKTLQDMVDLFRPPAEAFAAIVLVEGEVVPSAAWKFVKPKPGTNVVVNIVPTGGGGKKSPIASLLSIALLVAAPYISANITLALANSSALTALGGFGNTLIAGKILGAAVGIVGNMLINAIAPPPKPSNIGNVSNPTESPTMFIEGARNAIDPYGVIPVNLGTNRMFPKQAARPFTESQDNDQYVRQLFTWGYGKVELTDFRIGETVIEEFNDVQMEHRLAADMNEGIDLFPDDSFQDDYSVLIQQVDGYTVRTTRPDADEAVVDITFPQGLSEFNTQGKRIKRNVVLEMQYAPTGVSPQVWSSAAGSFTAKAGAVLTPTPVALSPNYTKLVSGFPYYEGFRKDIVVIDILSGAISLVKGTGTYATAESTVAPLTPANAIRIATVTVKSERAYTAPSPTNTLTIADDRVPAYVGANFQTSTDFAPTLTGSGTTVTIAAGGLAANPLDITAAQTEALRKSVYIKFPTRGQYDIRVRRISADTANDQIFDKASLTAIRTVTYRSPVEKAGLSGTAVRIKGSEQLNGALDEFNAIASTIVLDYDAGLDVWTERVSSNPAALYRFVLQNYGDGSEDLANARPLPDSKIDIDTLQEWHAICTANGYSYNRVIDYETSVDEVLRDIAAAGAAAPDIQDGKRTVVIDTYKETISQVITPRNSWSYNGVMVYPEMPHAFRVQFRNAAKGYIMDERIVYDDGYSEANATRYEVLELVSCTNSDLAFKTGRRHLAVARLRPETHSFMLDVENLVAVRGNRIKLAHDAPIIGIGDGRIKSVQLNNDSPQLVTGITIDDTVTIPSAGTYFVRVRMDDGTTLYKEISQGVGSHSVFTFTTPFTLASAPSVGNLCYFVEAGGEVDLVITKIEPQGDLTARITAVDYAPAVFTAETAVIPAFDSKITTPLNLIRPVAPVLIGQPQSDESVMIRNSDGSYTPRMVITLQNNNEGEIESSVSIRVTGSTSFTNANILESSPERIILTGLQDGTAYDVFVRYRRRGGSVYSLPLQINGYTFIGATSAPQDVEGFVVSIAEGIANFKWTPNEDIDVSHYKMKFARVFSGATWATAQLLEDLITTNRISTVFQGGTYLIKAVDILGNESVNATSIITYAEGALRNVVEVLEEDPLFTGAKDNVVLEGSSLVLDDITQEGFYYFADSVDLGDVFTSYISAAIVANGLLKNNLFDSVDLFGESDLFGQDGGDLFAIDDLFAQGDLFGIGEGAWSVQLQFRTSNMDSSPIVWSDWQEFSAGNIEFRAIEFRVWLQSFSPNVTPEITQLSATIDMPDRVEADSDLVVPITGLRVDFSPAFKKLDGLSIVAQDLAPGDVAIVTNKDELGFDIAFEDDVGGPVERTFDYVAKGYGRVVA